MRLVIFEIIQYRSSFQPDIVSKLPGGNYFIFNEPKNIIFENFLNYLNLKMFFGGLDNIIPKF